MTTSRRTDFQSNATSDSTAPSSSENSTLIPAPTTGLSSAVPSASLVASSLMTDSSIESSSLSQATALQSYTTASGSLSFVNPKPLLPGSWTDCRTLGIYSTALQSCFHAFPTGIYHGSLCCLLTVIHHVFQCISSIFPFHLPEPIILLTCAPSCCTHLVSIKLD